jgi:hypothetical protein
VSEADLWARVRAALAPHGRLVRVENRCDLGTPDVHYCLRRRPGDPATEGWLELKHVERWPPLARSLRVPSLTLDQVTWHEAHAAAGGRAWTLVQVGREGLLLAPAVLRQLHERELLTATARALAWPLTDLRGRALPWLTTT